MDNDRIDRARKLRSIVYPSNPGHPPLPPPPLNPERISDEWATWALSVAVVAALLVSVLVAGLATVYARSAVQVEAVSDQSPNPNP